MAKIEKSVFISYRRVDISWALSVYQYLTAQKYDVFFDYTSLSGGDFEQVIVSNIRARAHFVLILTPTALDRCNEPGDWLRREIETAVDEKRNIIPLFFDGFSFSSANITEKLTGKLAMINRYNGLAVPSGYFMEAMERLNARYLNIPLNAVIHPVPTEVQKVVREEQVAADNALREQKEDIQRLVKPVQENPVSTRGRVSMGVFRPYALVLIILLIAAFGFLGIRSLINNFNASIAVESAQTREATHTPTRPIPTSTATITPSPIPPTPTPKILTGSDGMTLLFVPAGEFEMGSEEGGDNEKPVHIVELDAFWIDQTEVTNAMFEEFVKGTDHITYAEIKGESYAIPDGVWIVVDGLNWEHPLGPSSGVSGILDHPVVHVSWDDAQAYCSWVGRRLPTEAEWEKAASWNELEKQKYIYPWGDEFDGSLLNFCDKNCSINWADEDSIDGYVFTAPVGTFPMGASPYGALDMAGNVGEWVDGLYDAYPGNTQIDFSEYSTIYRVFRGGAWLDQNYHVRSAYRGWFVPASSYIGVGFRCAMDAE